MGPVSTTGRQTCPPSKPEKDETLAFLIRLVRRPCQAVFIVHPHFFRSCQPYNISSVFTTTFQAYSKRAKPDNNCIQQALPGTEA